MKMGGGTFTKLKEIFTTEPVLAAPDLDKEMRVEADTSDYATGGVLSVKGEDGKWRPVVMNRQIPLSQYLYFFSFSFLLIM